MPQQITEQLIVVLFLAIGMLVTPLLFVALDFWAGIRKAQTRGDRIRSDKMQRTIRKLSRYYNAILAMMVLDAVQIAGFVFLHIYNDWTLYTFPFFTLLIVIFVAAIEIRSIMEPANEKESREMREVTTLAKAIASHKNDAKELADAIAEYLIQKQNNQS